MPAQRNPPIAHAGIAMPCARTASALLLVWCGAVAAQDASGAAVSTRFTSFFVGGNSSEFAPSFRSLVSEGVQNDMALLAESLLVEVPHLNTVVVVGAARRGDLQTKVSANTIFIRGLITRGDIRKVERVAIEEWYFNTTVTVEFFDIVTGEVYYTRSRTGEGMAKSAKDQPLSVPDQRNHFRTCLRATLQDIVETIGRDYKPGVVEGHIVLVRDTTTLVLDLGRKQGLYNGMTFYLHDSATGEPYGVARSRTPEERLCVADVVTAGGRAPRRGDAVKAYGMNTAGHGGNMTRYMVTDFSPANPKYLSPGFRVDPQSLGQWLHDALSQHTGLFLLAPLLAGLDSSGDVKVQEALFSAQTEFSIFGNVAQGALVGRRAFPDIMIRGVVTHADVETVIRPGSEVQVLEVGVSVEFYDRVTRDFIFATQHSERAAEKIVVKDGKVYRSVNLDAVFRDLSKKAITMAAKRVGERYAPQASDGTVNSVLESGALSVAFAGLAANEGDMYNLVRMGDTVRALDGSLLGQIAQGYGIARIAGRPAAKVGPSLHPATVLVTDGTTTAEPGDLLRAEGRNSRSAGGRLCRVEKTEAQGKLCEEYRYSLPKMTEWIHDALMESGKCRLLPPEYRASAMGMVEAALVGGDFERRDQREVIFQGAREPEILIYGRLGLADMTSQERAGKNKITIRAGVQVTFTTAGGDTLYTKKLVGSREIVRIEQDGQVMIGAGDLSPEFSDLTQNTINSLVQAAALGFQP